MPKLPKAEEFLSDPKHAESKEFFKNVVKGIAVELDKEKGSQKKDDDNGDDENIFDKIFGGK